MFKVAGNNQFYQLDQVDEQDPNSFTSPHNLNLEVSSLLSYSVYAYHSVWTQKDGVAYALGDNRAGQISKSLKKDIIKNPIEIPLKNVLSAICCTKYTIYLVNPGKSKKDLHLVYLNGKTQSEPITLNTGSKVPVALYGGNRTVAAIDSHGGIIVITEDMLEKEIFKPIMVKLPNSEKAIHIACCDKSILVLTKFGKVYRSNISYSNTLSQLTEVSELNDKKIVRVSGTYEHFLALTDDGKVYGQGSNNNCKLGLRKDTTGVDKFTQIPSLENCKIKDVYAGKENSLFIGKKGMVLGCGCCANGELFMATGNSYSQIFTPAESLIRKDTTFCIAGYDLSCACVGCEAPPNSPNMPHTTKYPQLIDPDFKPPEKVASKTSSALNVKPSKTDKSSAESPKLKELEEKVRSQSKEISSLKEIEKQQENKIKELQSQLKKASSQSADSLSFDPFEKEEEVNENYFIGEDDEANHEVIKRIGEGASAVTYKVFDKKTEKTMCKKVLKIDPNTTFKNAQDAMKEFEILYSIRHPCICRAIAINTTEPADEGMTTIALFLEFLNYGLKDCLDKKMIDNTLKARIVIEVVHGMKFIHTHGMIHRDLKIENIMLNSVFEAKLVDFGLVKIDECVHGANSALQTMTKGIGTLPYMSPEMVNEEPYTNKTDVYSFGVVLYYIFNGGLPVYSMRDKMLGKPVPLPNPSLAISQFCLDLIGKCLNADPNERPSFDEILNLMKENDYNLASDIDKAVISKRDRELDFYESKEEKKD